MKQLFTVKGRLPSYNDLRQHHMRAAKIKKAAMETIGWTIVAQGVEPVSGPATIKISCYEPNAKRDPDNVTSGAAKCILDSLQKMKIIKNDNRKHVKPILPVPKIDRENPRVEVLIQDIGEG